MKKAYLLVFLFVLVLPSISQSFDISDHSIYNGLKGIEELQILNEDLPSGALDMGLTREQLIKTVELKLLLAGIKPAETSSVIIYVQATVLPIAMGGIRKGYAISLSLRITQQVFLEREPSQTVFGASTWQRGNLGIEPQDSRTKSVIERLETLLDDFLIDYLKTNPK